MGRVPAGHIAGVMGVCLSFLAVMPAGNSWAASGDIWQIRETASQILTAPRVGAEVVTQLQPEHRMVEFARQGDWLRVGVFRLIGVEGWIPAGSVVSPQVATPAKDGISVELPAAGLAKIAKEEGAAKSFELNITGTPGLKFKGRCRTVGGGGSERRLSLSGHVPARYAFRTAALSCRVRKWDALGRFEAALSRAGWTISEVRTSAPFNVVRVRSDGPWGPASAKRGRGALLTLRPEMVSRGNSAKSKTKVLARPH